MLRIRTLGALAVERDGARVSGAAAQPRRLALLAMIARAGAKGISRDTLLTTLWPDVDEEAARHALKQSLYALRRDLGENDVFLGTHDLRLNDELVRSDVGDFEALGRRGELERAVDGYGGPFLEGFRLSGVPEFELWMEEERRALDGMLASILERLATTARANGDLPSVIRWLKRRAALEPLNARVTVELMHAHLALGDRVAALQQARIYEALVAQALDLPPDESVRDLVEGIRAGRVTAAPIIGATPIASTTPTVAAPIVTPPAAPPHPPAADAQPTGAMSRQDHPVAVAPFALIPETEEARTLRDGLREELLSALGGRGELSVVGRWEPGAPSAPGSPQIAPAAMAAMVAIEGSIRVGSGAARVSARLTRLSDARILWSERFDVVVRDELSVLESLAVAIADGAERALREAAGLPSGPSARERADALYARGLHAWTPQGAGLGQGLEEFRAAVAIDPTHARAHAALAESYTQLAFYGFLPARRAAALVDGASREAMRLAPELAESHLARGTALLWVDRAFGEGIRELQHALALDPTLAMARARLAFVQLCHDGPREGERSTALQAATTVGAPGLSRIMYGQQLLAAARYDEAIEALLQAIDIEAPSFLAYHWLSAAYVGMGKGAEAVAAAVAEASLSGHHPWSFASLITACALAGQRRRAVTLLETLRTRATTSHVQQSILGLAHAAIGDVDAGMRLLELAIEEHDPSMMMLRNFPMFAPFRKHPRFRALLREAGWRDWDTAEFRVPRE